MNSLDFSSTVSGATTALDLMMIKLNYHNSFFENMGVVARDAREESRGEQAPLLPFIWGSRGG